MEAEATRIGDQTGLAWIRPIATAYTYNAAAGLFRVTLPLLALTHEQTERLEVIDARMAAIQSELEDEELAQDAYEALDEEHDGLEEERQTIHDRPAILANELRPLVGAFLTLSPKGELVLDGTY